MSINNEAPRNFCQQPSKEYLRLLLEEAGDDPRALAGLIALLDLRRYGSWMPTVDARDARRPSHLGGKKKRP